MGRSYFEFKRFTVFHDRCAMKVGTDGVLLGAWSDLDKAGSVLDIGTGTGLLALMVAQRSQATVTGVDIDEEAIRQARENALRSCWANRLSFVHTDVLTYTPEVPFDTIVCNPPFFDRSLSSPDRKRTQARHTSALPLEKLAQTASRLLTEEGRMSVVLPVDVSEKFMFSCWEYGLQLYRKCTVSSKPGKAPKRVLLGFVKGHAPYPSETHLYLTDSDGRRSEEYASLTKDFYL